jgi:uncharacterized MnhB-related membrane protein
MFNLFISYFVYIVCALFPLIVQNPINQAILGTVLTLSTVVGFRLILNAVTFRGGFGFISLVSVILTDASLLDPVIK